MTTESDWYTDKGRVAHFTGSDITAGEVSDYDMDAAYKWVNVQLSRRAINSTTNKVQLQADPNITMAQTWYACFLVTQVIKGNQNPTRILPDGQITSQNLGQGEVSLGYQPNAPSEHYDELTTPNFYMLAQRAMRDFFNNMIDAFDQPVGSIMSKSNSFDREFNPDFANRLYQRGRRIFP